MVDGVDPALAGGAVVWGEGAFPGRSVVALPGLTQPASCRVCRRDQPAGAFPDVGVDLLGVIACLLEPGHLAAQRRRDGSLPLPAVERIGRASGWDSLCQYV